MNALTTADLDEAFVRLSSADWRSMSVEQMEEFLPTLGLNGENLDEMPPELGQYFGVGLKSWQYPNQFAKLLALVKERPAVTYLEIGSRWGGSFVIIDALLRSLNQSVQSFAIDLLPCPELLQRYRSGADITYIQGDSRNARTWSMVPPRVDIVFIDGDHSWDGVHNDFSKALQLEPHTVILHDTDNDHCPDVRAYWRTLCRSCRTKEFHDQYPSVSGNYLGIGVVFPGCSETIRND